ncbi:SUMF1/EgtB/PvdO family nonheme iron enzyme [Myxococcota bacterium]|nr:SUMF1/EgtB/PvdO family nonheme iron enzyme [Myxococcota bacterium]MBU1429644.1 SUMF1/EgtB/PvdO family nonheme iron enzyme [Myxococcota bacterium]
MMQREDAPKRGENILGYALINKIGGGGMGTVWRAEHARLKRRVAIKILDPRLRASAEFVTRFIKEAEILAQLRHPNILSVENISEDPLAIIMEYIGGGTLEDQIPEEGMTFEAAWPYFRQIIDGVAYAHAQGVIHRDLKPANVLLTKEGEVKIADFGIAKLTGGQRITQTGVLFGTPAYMSPEQITAPADLTPASDLYTCAIILYEMLTGQPPFGGEATSDFDVLAGHVQRPPPDPSARCPQITPPLRAALLRALDKDPAARFESMTAFGQALARCLAPASADEIDPLSLETSWAAPPSQGPWLKLIGGLLILALGLSGYIYFTASVEPPALPPSPAARGVEAPKPPPPPDPPHQPIEWITLEGGAFMMGAEDGGADERPIHRVEMSPFAVSKSETTVGQYRECVEAGICRRPRTIDDDPACHWGQAGRQDHPINCLDWDQAHIYAQWVGGRLLTEAEWEYAARSKGLPVRYPWGSAPPTPVHARFDAPKGRPAPVCAQAQGHTRQGLCDMAGNVWEWVADSYANDYRQTPLDGRAYQSVSVVRVARGGSYRSTAKQLRVSERSGDFPNHAWGPELGLRVAREVE